MQPIETRRARVLIVVLSLAIVTVAHVGAGASATESTGDDAGAGGSQVRSAAASDAETAIARADLVGRMEDALGGSFAGAWFDPATARLHVGAPSTASAEIAESVAAEAGLAGIVTVTPVDHTWARLRAVQDAWRHRFIEHVPSGTFTASLVARDNSVKIELGSDVPSHARAALRSDAATASVAISLSVAPSESLEITPYERCAKFVPFKAYCDPTLVSGVSIIGEKEGTEGVCTAGVPLIRKAPKNETEATETFLITAGHCLVGVGAPEKEWAAFEAGGTRKGIGPAKAALEYPGSGIDAGVIQISKKPWADATKASPLTPVIAQWSTTEKTNPFELIEETTPAEKMLVCYSGQRTGTQCGEIIEAEKAEVIKDGGGKVIVEWVHANVVQLEGGKKAGQGDSGAPFFEQEPFKTEQTGYVLGTLVGGTDPGESNKVIFQRLAVQLAGLAEQKSLSLELLTPANETRH